MSYTIVRTNGTVLTTIPDGVVNTTSTPLSLPGRNFASYGQIVDTNFVRALENFADTTVPANPIRGQLWYKTDNQTLYICPTDGETNAANWFPILTPQTIGNLTLDNLTANANVNANNATITNTLDSNNITTDYLTVSVNANVAQANISGVAYLNEVNTRSITAGTTSTLGNIVGSWTVNGGGTVNSIANTSLWVTGGNLVITDPVNQVGIRTDNYMFANGAPVSFDGAYTNSNVASYLPTYTGNVGSAGSATVFNGRTLSTGASVTTGTIVGNWSLSAGSKIIGLTDVNGANVVGTVANAAFATTADVANTVSVNAQPNITSVGTLTSLNVSGGATIGGISNLGQVGNVRILGGAAGQVLSTNGSGGLSWQSAAAADTAITVTANAQPNITSVGTLTGLTVTGNAAFSGSLVNLGAVGNLRISGGTVGQVLLSTGTGGVIWGSTGASADTANTVIGNSQPNITSVGTLTSLNVSGGATIGGISNLGQVGNVRILGGAAGQVLSTNGSGGLSWQSAAAATTAITVTANAQPNITSVGTLTGLTVTGSASFNSPVVNLGAVGNLRISGGSAGQVLSTDGSGGLSWQSAGSATTAITVTANAQPNITSVGTLTSLNVTGNVNAGNVYANAGTIGADRLTGTLTTNAQPNITSLGTLFGLTVTGNASFTGANVSLGSVANLRLTGGTSGQVLTSTGSGGLAWTTGVAAASTAVTVTGNAQPNITSVGTLTSLDVSGNIAAGNVSVTGRFLGNGNGLTNIPGANVTGTVPAASLATIAGTVTTASQPNITSIGTLTSLNVSGNANVGNIGATNIVGSGASLTNLNAGNLSTGTVPSARLSGTYSISISGAAATATSAGTADTANTASFATNAGNASVATIAGTVTTASQPNITSIGTLTSLNVSGNVNAGNVVATNIVGSGASLTNLNASNLSSGTVPSARLSGNYNINISGSAATATSAGTANSAATASFATEAANATNAVTAARAGTVTTAAQPNITSVGTLSSLAVSGSLTRGGSPVVALNDFQLSSGTSGTTTLPNGLTMKWGETFISSSPSIVTVTFPTPFPTNAFQVFLTLKSNPNEGDEADETFWVSSVSSTQFTISIAGDRNSVTMAYFAIGN